MMPIQLRCVEIENQGAKRVETTIAKFCADDEVNNAMKQ
jgi:hypothetical protein